MMVYASFRRESAARLSLWVAALILICQALCASNTSAQKLDFSDTTFTEPVNWKFWERSLRGDSIEIDRSRVIFHWPVAFECAIFGSWVDFEDAIFDSSAAFRYASFNSIVDFEGASFNSMAYFNRSRFGSTADFSESKFNSMADFRWARFGPIADFRWVRFDGPVDFREATLPDTLDFRWVTEIEREVDFTFARRPSSQAPCLIALAGTDISKIKLQMRLFKLWFPPWKKESEDMATTYDQKASVYESVLNKLKDDGFEDSYEILDIEYRRLKAEHQGIFNRYFLDTWQDWWWNYGYTKERIVLWTILLWALISCINLGLYHRLNEHVYTVGFLESEQDLAEGRMSNLILHIMRVVTYTALIFFGLKMSVDKFSEGVIRRHPWLFCYLMVVYVVGLVCLGFIANMVFAR
jgi:hypothetical protein